MTNEDKEKVRPILFFLIGFLGFQLLWYFVILPLL